MLSKELQAKAKWVADLMIADGVKPEQLTVIDKLTEELMFAYMDVITKKIAAIQSTYLTRNGAKQAMKDHILNICGVQS